MACATVIERQWHHKKYVMLPALIHSWCASLRDLNHNSLRALVRRCAFPIGQYECFRNRRQPGVARMHKRPLQFMRQRYAHPNEGLHTASSKSSWRHLPCHHMDWRCWPSSIIAVLWNHHMHSPAIRFVPPYFDSEGIQTTTGRAQCISSPSP